jgi:hypothetical protein
MSTLTILSAETRPSVPGQLWQFGGDPDFRIKGMLSQKGRNLREGLGDERIVAPRPKTPLKTHSRFLPLKKSQSREFRVLHKSMNFDEGACLR